MGCLSHSQTARLFLEHGSDEGVLQIAKKRGKHDTPPNASGETQYAVGPLTYTNTVEPISNGFDMHSTDQFPRGSTERK